MTSKQTDPYYGLPPMPVTEITLEQEFKLKRMQELLKRCPPDQMIEYGKVLPKSGQEKKWFNSLSPSLRQRLKKMEK